MSSPLLAPGRPVVHLAPPTGWMNDPVGLSLADGVWHAYYQHHPSSDEWGPMHWGHASSADLIAWHHHPIALAPTELGDIWSGSIVVDTENSAGFGPGARVALFTFDDREQQRQGLAWSSDGVSWTMYPGNPVLSDSDATDFRDPKVIRCRDHWAMVLAVGAGVRFYRSDDLLRWEAVGEYAADVGGVVECPDLVAIPRPTGTPAWALIYSDSIGGVTGHGQNLAVLGEFDGSSFVAEAEPVALDHGPDFYAAQSFHGLAQGQPPVVLGWMNSWRYAGKLPSAGVRGVMSLPRKLELDGTGAVRVTPAVDLDRVFSSPAPGDRQADAALRVRGRRFGLGIRGEHGGDVTLEVDDGTVVLQRGHIGVDGYAVQVSERLGVGEVDCVIDQGTLEVFAGNGRSASALFFCGTDWHLEIDGDAEVSATPDPSLAHRTAERQR